jgi:hypothetical protein
MEKRGGGGPPPPPPPRGAPPPPVPAARADPPDSTPARPDQNRISAVKTVTEAFEPTPRALALKSQPVPKLRFR